MSVNETGPKPVLFYFQPVRFYSPCYADPSISSPLGLGDINPYASIKSEEESSEREEERERGRQTNEQMNSDEQQWIPMRQLFNAHRL